MYFSSTCDVQSSTTTFIDNIPLTSTRNDPSSYQQHTDQDDDIIGEEIRPTPVNTMDVRIRTVHAVQHDHTYINVAILKRAEIETTPDVSKQQIQLQQQQQKLLAASNCTATGPVNSSNAVIGLPLSITTIGNSVNSPSSSLTVSPTKNPLLTKTASGYTYTYNTKAEKDDDASSVISTGSRTGNNLEPDMGEETDTAAEGEPDDDSVTRCICEFTHDDGYMICCDKCS